MANKIFIFSRPIRTGKTTELMEWVAGKSNVAGFLTPDVNEARMLYDIEKKTSYKMQLNEADDEESISVGRFLFSKKAFNAAKSILANAAVDWLIIDEAGKLEIEQHLGLEPELSNIIDSFRKSIRSGNLILVIRDTLVEKAVKKYDLEDARIIHSLKELC